MILNFKHFKNNERVEQEIIYDQCHRKLFFTALRILNNQFEAEEVMHDTLLKFFSLEEQFGTIKERDSWMSRVCINMAIDLVRKRRVEISKRENLEQEEFSMKINEPEMMSLNGVTPQMIKDALKNISQGYRIVLSLYLFEGYDYEEISQILDIKEVSVRTQFIRGKVRLIAQIENLKETKKGSYGTY